MAARQPNLWPLSRKTAKAKPAKTKKSRSSLTVGQALDKAFAAGQKIGDTGVFDSWLAENHLDTRGKALVQRLRQHFEQGVEDGEGTTYRGQKIEVRGHKQVFIPGVVKYAFSTLESAKHFLDFSATNPTDRAHRYRANATPPAGPKRCAFCGSKNTIEVGHIDGHEENGEPDNLIWTCRSCNVIAGNTLKNAKLGRRTRQFNPTKSGGAANVGEWMNAIGAIVPHKGAKYAGENYGIVSTMSTSDAVAMIRATPQHKRSEYAGKIGKTKSGRASAAQERWNPKKKRKNPQAEADALYKSFHGKPSRKTVEIEDQVHEHEHLAALGKLVEIWVETVTGLLAHLRFDPENAPYLASSEDGRQLYIEGGDQELDLGALKMDGEEWRKDRMVIGTFARPEPRDKGRGRRKHNITYHTKKKFDDFQPIDYEHDLGEETGVRPILEYEPRNQRLFISGGQYRIEQPLLDMSPGIEN